MHLSPKWAEASGVGGGGWNTVIPHEGQNYSDVPILEAEVGGVTPWSGDPGTPEENGRVPLLHCICDLVARDRFGRNWHSLNSNDTNDWS